MINKKIDVQIELCEGNKLTMSAEALENVEYAYYVYKDGVIIEKFFYSDRNTLTYWLGETGTYCAKIFIKDKDGNKVSKKTDEIFFEEEKVFGEVIKEEKVHLWDRVIEVSKELVTNFPRTARMAQFEYKLENKGTYLGAVWSILTPLIKIGTYWLVFGVGIRGGRVVNGYPYLVWMLTGLIPWFFISGCILGGANSIYSKIRMVSKMKFPIATIPISQIIQRWYGFLVTLVIMLIALLCNGVMPNLSWLNLIYYVIYSTCLCMALALVTSVFSMLVRDFYNLLSSLIRLLFYLTPILWTMDNMPVMFQQIMQYNPAYYVICGFRDSILYQKPFYERWEQAIVMWTIVLGLYIWGCALQSKFKNKFVDLI